MKTLMVSLALGFITSGACASSRLTAVYEDSVSIKRPHNDSVKLVVENENAYYQRAVKVDSNIKEPLIYIRTLQFAAAKNFQQNYGYQEEGKLIFTTTQDLNISPVFTGEDDEDADQYTVQFALTLDLKNGLYRYTIQNITFYIPGANGNRRETMYDVYAKATNKDSRRVAKNAKKLIDSFERYLNKLTNELYEAVEQKLPIYKSKF